jgi:hypothetical protein
MYSSNDASVQYLRFKCPASAALGVQRRRHIQSIDIVNATPARRRGCVKSFKAPGGIQSCKSRCGSPITEDISSPSDAVVPVRRGFGGRQAPISDRTEGALPSGPSCEAGGTLRSAAGGALPGPCEYTLGICFSKPGDKRLGFSRPRCAKKNHIRSR